MPDVKRALAMSRYTYYTSTSRQLSTSVPKGKVIRTLAEVGVPMEVFDLLIPILREIRITINGGVAKPSSFTQTTGRAQKANLCPLLFSISLKGPSDQIIGSRKSVGVTLNTTDLVIYRSNMVQVRQALARFHAAFTYLGLTMNLIETEAVKFGRAGRTELAFHISRDRPLPM